jgi:hypothetical protein
MIKLQLGFTDQDTENFIHEDNADEDSLRYNIIKQSPELEKASVEWKFNIDVLAVQNIIEAWENIIRGPHLAMVHKNKRPAHLLPTHFSYTINLEFINLLPLKYQIKMLQEEDFDNFTSSTIFGNLYLDVFSCYEEAGYDYAESAEYAIQNDTLEFYNIESEIAAIPRFTIDFSLNRHRLRKTNVDTRFARFMEKHDEEFKVRNIDKEHFKKKYGRLCIGELLTDPADVYNILSSYPYVCRTSFVKE